PLPLHKSGVPYIHFPPYSRSEALALINASPSQLSPNPYSKSTVEFDEKTLKKLYLQFTAAVYDSLIAPTSSTSLAVFRSTCEKLWPRFIWPYISGETPPGKAKSWDFARLMIQNRALFQA